MCRLPTLFALLALLCSLAIGLVGCGGSAGNAGADPAAAVPRNAFLYVEGKIKPEGEVRDGALAAAGKILDTPDPAAKLRDLIDQAFDDDEAPKVKYSRDLHPWLGQRAGLWISRDASQDIEKSLGIVAAVEDTEAGLDFVERQRGKDKQASHNGTEYYVDADDGMAYGISGDYLLIASPDRFKQMVDLVEGKGETLAKADAYRKSMDDLSEERLVQMYLDVNGALDLAAKLEPQDAGDLQAFRQLLGSGPMPVAVAGLADAERVALEMILDARSSKLGALTGTSAESSPLLGELPGDAWGAYAVADIGKSYSEMIKQFGGALGYAAISSALRQQIGLSIEEDVLSWMGDVAFFVRGESVADIDGAVVIEATDDAKAAQAFGKISGILRTRASLPLEPTSIEGAETAFKVEIPGAPKPAVLARAEGRVIAAFGEKAAADALSPSSKFSESEIYSEAKESLGDGYEPMMVFSAPQVLSLLESAGLGSDAGYKAAEAYLDALSTLSVSGKQDGGKSKAILSVGLK